MNITPKIILLVKQLNISNANLNRYLANNYPLVYTKLIQQTQFLSEYYTDKVPILARMYCIEKNITSYPVCSVCGKQVRFKNYNDGFAKWCSISCSAKDVDTVAKSKQTRLARYGNENYVNTSKAKQTVLTNIHNDPEYYNNIVNKIKQTKLHNHGNENFVNSEKSKSTKLEKYGISTYNNTEKTKQTKLEKYGNENYNNREKFLQTIESFSEDKKQDIINKRKTTCIEKYGCDSYSKTIEYKEKVIQTNNEKYGVNFALLRKECIMQRQKTAINKTWQYIISNNKYSPMFDLDEYALHHLEAYEYKWKCNNCNAEFYAQWKDGYVRKRCPNCEPKLNMVAQTELYNFISSIYSGTIITNTKHIISPLELDIYLPEQKIAIEYDGLYWHSDDKKPRTYHLEKTELCEKQGIQLIHIFEDEWLYNTELIKNRLKNLLGVYDKTIYARKCVVKEITNKTAKALLDKNHIQGNVNANVCLGLYYNDELVSVMTFGKSRYNKKYEWELLRFCNECAYHVIGGASKLLKYFERMYKPNSLLSYADRRWSKGNLYSKLGFELVGKSSPNYWYFKKGNAYKESRINYQKHKLKDKLPVFSEELSEYENMKNNGYNRIYDCGNLVFVKMYNY